MSDLIDDAVDIILPTLAALVEAACKNRWQKVWLDEINKRRQKREGDIRPEPDDGRVDWELYVLFTVIRDTWNEVFALLMPHKQRMDSLRHIELLIQLRNVYAHPTLQRRFNARDAARFLDYVELILRAMKQNSAADRIAELYLQNATALGTVRGRRIASTTERHEPRPQTNGELDNEVPPTKGLGRIGKQTYGTETIDRDAEIDLPTIADSLRSLVKQDKFFDHAGLRGRAAAIIEDVISFAPALGRESGLSADRIKTRESDAAPAFPKCVWDFYHDTPIDSENREKIFLVAWEPPIIDTGGVLKLELVTRDWHLKRGLEECTEQLRQTVLDDQVDFESLPGALAMAITIETTKDSESGKLLLCQRGKTHDNPFEWMVGIGELMQPSDGNGSKYSFYSGIHPLHAVLRGVGEELGLERKAPELLRKSEVSFLAMARSAKNLNYNLLCHIRLPTSSDQVIQWWRSEGEGEIIDVRGVDFELDGCVNMLVSGLYSADSVGRPIPIVSWSRAALLWASVKKFRTESVQSKLAALLETTP
jgi:hypothetical protein